MAPGAGSNFSTRCHRSAEPAPGRSPVRAALRLASSLSSLVQSPFGPVPAIAIQAGMPRRTTTPQCRRRGRPRSGLGVGYRPRRPGRHRRAARPGCRSAGPTGPRERRAAREPGLEFTQSDAGQLALPLELFESPGPLGLLEPLGQVATSLSSHSSSAVIRGSGLVRPVRTADLGGRPVRRASPGPGLPRAAATPRLADRAGPAPRPGRCRLAAGSRTFQASEGDPEPGRVQTLHRIQPSVPCLT